MFENTYYKINKNERQIKSKSVFEEYVNKCNEKRLNEKNNNLHLDR